MDKPRIRIFKTKVIDVHPNGKRHYPEDVSDRIHKLRSENYIMPEELVLFDYENGLDFRDVWVMMRERPRG